MNGHESPAPVRAMRAIRVRRSYLVRLVQEFDVEIPVEYDTEEWLTNDFGSFDEYVCAEGYVRHEEHETIDDDDLDLEVIPNV